MSDIFVVGSPRSGGTLIYNIICSDPSINPALRENHFVSITLADYSFMLSRISEEDGHFFDLDMTKQFYAKWIQSFLDEIHKKYSHFEKIAIKSISLAPYISLLHELLPDIRYCISVRDPRDIVASMIEVGLKQQQIGKQPQYHRDAHNLSLQVMDNYIPAINSSSKEFHKMVTWVKYESLVYNTASIISQLEHDLDLDLSLYNPDQNWPRSKVNIEECKQNDPFITELWGGKISNASIGKYKMVLNQHEIKVVENICAPLMQLFAYESETG